MKSISTKISVLTSAIALSIAVVLVIVFYFSFNSMVHAQTSLLDKTLRESFDRSVRWEVETANSMLLKIDSLKKDGTLTQDQANILARKMLRDLRYNTDGYFWADTADGTNVVLMGQAQEGKNRMESVDSNGYPYMKNIIANGMKKGGGYTDYQFPKAGTTVPLPKRSYSLMSEPWGWILGTGAYIDDIDALVSAKASESASSMNRSLLVTIALSLAASIFAALISIRVGLRLAKPIIYAANQTEIVASGDLSNAFEERMTAQKDETGLLLRSLDTMRSDLSELIGGIMSTSEKIRAGSQELSQTSQEVSNGTSQQASSTEEISASIEQMTSTIRQNAENATETERIARKSAMDAAEGGKVVTDAVTAVKKIAEKIAVIEEIARQTNLLALNAAIEAARAGDAGKGFSVVAGEIRKLAERSGSSASEIQKLSAETTAMAVRAGEVLASLTPDIGKTADLVAEINAATGEQRIGAEQIAQAMTQLDSVVQKNAAASEELAGSAQSLNDEAASLRENISRFKVE